MIAKLSTHVLDNHSGRPAAGVPIAVERRSAQGDWILVTAAITNQDGRTSTPLLSGDQLQTACYRLSFNAASYYADAGVPLSEPPFLTVIPIVVNLAAGQSYHVPLLMTPWSYSTYRGS